jgi:ribonuclease BN (tRNA processing enzyme)
VLHPAALELARDVDVLIHDAQYTCAELPARATWGHSAADYAARLGAEAGAHRVLLYHHDPARTDDQVARLLADVRASRPRMRLDAAMEGMVIEL